MVEIVGVHPYADKFPMLSDAEIDEMAESISTVGLIHPVVVDPAGLVLDGRNRLEACDRAQVEVHTEVYEGDAAEYVIACNVARRNMTTGQRAMATALVLEADGRRRENGRWRRGSVRVGQDDNYKSINSGEGPTWSLLLHHAGIILDYKPDLAQAVVNGAMALDAAFKAADSIRTSAERDKIFKRERAKREKEEAKAEAARNAEIVADLTQAGAQQYLDLIAADTMTPKAAWAAHREDTRLERERLAAEREVLRDRYTSMAQACLTAASWGAYEDGIQGLMAEFDPALLNPPQLDRYFDPEPLVAVRRFADELIAWRNSYVRR